MEILGTDPPTVERIRERRERLEERLQAVAEVNGHDPGRLRVVAITKAWPVEVARAALEAGCMLLGESWVQEAEPKVAALPQAEWHFVGRLQSNKARRAVRAFAAIHSVDSLELLGRIVEMTAEEDRSPRLLLQVNVTGDPAKAGMSPEGLTSRDALAALRAAQPVGLMTIGLMGASNDEARAAFRRLHLLRDRLREAAGIPLPELSMGMTADADAAAAEGATLVRLGTALFGPRP